MAPGYSTINDVIRVSAGLFRTVAFSVNKLYDLWLFGLDVLERIIKGALLCAGIHACIDRSVACLSAA